jgi:hypothetical protein
MTIDTTDFDFLDEIVEKQEETPVEDNDPVEAPTETAEDPAEPEPEDNDDYYTKYFDFLKEQGAIQVPKDFDFKPTEEGFLEAVEATKQLNYDNALDELWKALPETGKPLLEYFLSGGTDVSKYLQAYTSVDLDDVDLDDEDNQIRVLRQYYKEIFNYADDKTSKMISRLQAKDGLKEGAFDAIEDLKEHKTSLQARLVADGKKEKEAKIRQQEQEKTQIKESLKDFDTSKQTKIEALLFNPMKYEDQVTTEFNYYLNKIATNPKHLVQLADLLVDYSPEKGFNLDRFEQRVITKKTQSLKALIESKMDPRKQASSGSNPSPKGDHFPFDKFLNS